MAIDSQEELFEAYLDFFKTFQTDDGDFKYVTNINKMIREGQRSLTVQYDDLVLMDDIYDLEISTTLTEKPFFTIDIGSRALTEQVKIENPDYHHEVTLDKDTFSIRFANPPTPIQIRDIRANHVDSIRWLQGIVIRTTEIKSIITEAVYFCAEPQQHRNLMIFQDGIYTRPDRCFVESCKSKEFVLDPRESKMIDWQMVTLQEKPENLPPGASPKSIPCRVVDDIVNAVRPGDRIQLGGLVRTRPSKIAKKGQILTYDMWIDVNYIESLTREDEYADITLEEEKQIRELAQDPKIHDRLVESVAPAIFGMNKVKEATLLMLFGGVDKTFPDGFSTRGQSNLLLVGDPGVAKCIHGNSKVLLANGTLRPIEDIVEEKLVNNMNLVDDGYYATGNEKIVTLDKTGKVKISSANIFWKRYAPKIMYKILTSTGKKIEVTPTHPFFITENGLILTKKSQFLNAGDKIATPRYLPICSSSEIALEIQRTQTNTHRLGMGIPQTTYQHYERGDRNPSIQTAQKVVSHLARHQQSDLYDRIKSISESDIYWDEIVRIEIVEPEYEWVYDLQVPNTHNYVSEGIFTHNSQLLRYVQAIAPRGLYTSGRGSSAAGLTAAIIRDPDTGEISLEAGALVLADRGLCLIDEFDKMNENDRSAIHEAMEQHTISIAKAGIVATLNARTGVLAAANPKYGRYEPHRTFSENVNLSPAILSRFDLVFILKDEPEAERDQVLANHILKLHRFHGTGQSVIPPLNKNILKKYIAFAKTYYNPTLTEESTEVIEEFYVNMRSSVGKTGDEGDSRNRVTITARQLEGIIRMAEARARASLRNNVTKQDALKAIELMNYSLSQIAIDPATGEADIDGFYSGQTSSKRSKLTKLLSIIDFLYRDAGGVPFQEELLLAEAENEGIAREYTKGVVQQMLRDGQLYQPKSGWIKRPDS